MKGRQQALAPGHGTLVCLFSSPQTLLLPGERARLASRSFGAKGQVIPKHATRWQRTWNGLQEAPVRDCRLWLHENRSPLSLICEQSSSSDGFACRFLNPNEQNTPSPIWAVYVCMRVHTWVHVCNREGQWQWSRWGTWGRNRRSRRDPLL